MKILIAAAVLAAGMTSIAATSADAGTCIANGCFIFHRYHQHQHCTGWGWRHHNRFCRSWGR